MIDSANTVTVARLRNKGMRIVRTRDHLFTIEWWLTYFSSSDRRYFFRELAARSGFSRTYCAQVCASSPVGRPAMNWIICREAMKLKEEFNASWVRRNTPRSKALRQIEILRAQAATATRSAKQLERQLQGVAL